MKKFRTNKYREIDIKIKDGDLIFGVAYIIKKIKLHIVTKSIWKDISYIEQADLTNDIWSYSDHFFRLKRNNERTKGFSEHISNHDRYNVAFLFVNNIHKDRVNVFKKTSKCGLEYQLLIQKSKVHFFTDGLNISAISNKSGQEGRSVTASELRWLFRHRHITEVKENLLFWNNFKEISHHQVFSEIMNAYTPRKIYYDADVCHILKSN